MQGFQSSSSADPATARDAWRARLLREGELLDQIEVGLCAFDEDDRTVAWNSTFLRFFPEHDGQVHEGEPYASNLRRFYQKRLTQEELPKLEEYVAAGLARHRSQVRPYEFSHAGRLLTVASQAEPGLGRVRLWRASGGQEALPQSAASVSQHALELVEFVPEALMICDGEGRLMWANRAFCRMYDATLAALAGRTLEDIYRKVWDGAAADESPRHVAGQAILRENLRFSGAPFELPLPGQRTCRVIAQRARNGVVIQAHVDLTGYLHVQRQLSEKAQALEITLESMSQGIATYDASGRLVMWNHTYAELLDLPLDYLQRHPTFAELVQFQIGRGDFAQSPDVIVDIDVHSRSPAGDGGRAATESEPRTYSRRTTNERVLEVHVRPLSDGGAVRTVTDITERTLAQEEIIRARDVAEAGQRAKAEFLANMSHEIRTPMNAIIGLATLLAGEPLEPRQRQFVDQVRAAGEHLLRIVNDILDFSKVDAGLLEVESVDFEISEVVERVRALVADSAAEKRLALFVSYAPGLPSRVRGDPMRIGQILLNYVNNAIKFTAQGGVKIRVEQEAPEGAAMSLRFTVSDTGIGLEPDQRERLFKSFSQADASTTRRFGGTGLGLAICKKLAERMGGAVGVESQLGKGSAFWFTVRVEATSPTEPLPVASEEATDVREALAGTHILLVEDNLINQIVAREFLASWSAKVSIANDGKQAVDLAAQTSFDAILMDMQMPVMDGLEATRLIRASPAGASVLIIAMTANAMAADRQACISAGMNDVVVKPFEPMVLLRTLRQWLARAGRG